MLSNFETFSLAQLIIWFFIIFLCAYILITDIQHRKIRNISLIILGILTGIHSLINFSSISWMHLSHIVLIAIAGWAIYERTSIGAGDIKLAIILSFFFIAPEYPSALAFLGNTACIALVFIFAYALGYATNQKKDPTKKIFKLRKPSKSDIAGFMTPLIIGGGILISIRFLILNFGGNTEWLRYIPHDIGSIMVLYAILRPYVSEYIVLHKSKAYFVGLISMILIIMTSSTYGLLGVLGNTYLHGYIAMGIFSLCLSLIQYLYRILSENMDHKITPIEKLRKHDVIDRESTITLWKKLSGWTHEQIGEYITRMHRLSIPEYLQESKGNTIANSRDIRFLQKIKNLPYSPLKQVVTIQTLPFSVFIITGFFLTLATKDNIAGNMVQYIFR